MEDTTLTTVTPSILRLRCDQIIADEKISKDAALAILTLFHDTELMLADTDTAKQREIDALRHEIDLMHMANRNTEMLLSLTSDITQLKNKASPENEVLTLKHIKKGTKS